MVLVQKIDSNATGLRFAEELSIGVLPGTPVWNPLEPNSYDNFGGEITTVARNPINASRQRQKGAVTDLDASGGFNTDMTQDNLQDILQGFFFADLRRKGEEVATSVTIQAGDDTYELAATAGFLAGGLMFATGFTNAGNNGLKLITAVVLDTTVAVVETLVTNATPPVTNNMVVVGHQAAAGDIDVDATGALPALTTMTLDFTTLGLVPGEFIFIGGDLAVEAFTNAVNNGFARIKTIAANRLEFDKTQGTMVTEASTTETIRLFFGRVLKNEGTPALIKRRTYQLERALGAPDEASPAEIQGEYLVGSVPNQITFNFNTADKVTADLSFVSTDNEQVTSTAGLKSGTRPTLVSGDSLNTTDDFSRLKMAILDPASSNPTALFAFLTEFTVVINNNVSPNKAISVLGAFEVTAGQFNVEGTATAYFSQVEAVQAVRNNSDVTLDFALVKGRTVSGVIIKSGVVVDVPLIALGDGRLNVEQDQPITLPLSTPAAADRNFNHTLLMVFFDFLPNVADV